MARKSLLARETKKRKMAEKYAALRKELKEKGDYDALQALLFFSLPFINKHPLEYLMEAL